jgi:hypothetical protein
VLFLQTLLRPGPKSVSAAMKRSGVTVVVSVNRIVGTTTVLQPGAVSELRGCECRLHEPGGLSGSAWRPVRGDGGRDYAAARNASYLPSRRSGSGRSSLRLGCRMAAPWNPWSPPLTVTRLLLVADCGTAAFRVDAITNVAPRGACGPSCGGALGLALPTASPSSNCPTPC